VIDTTGKMIKIILIKMDQPIIINSTGGLAMLITKWIMEIKTILMANMLCGIKLIRQILSKVTQLKEKIMI